MNRPATAPRTPRAADLERWARGVAMLTRDLQQGRLDPPGWQMAVAAFSRTLAAGDLLDCFDTAPLGARQRSFGPGEHRVAVLLPGPAGLVGLAAELVLLSAGSAVPPHGHNNLASVHLVLHGTGQVRLHDRLADLPASVLLRPAGEIWLEPGASFTAAESAANVHWLSAGATPLVLLDLVIAVPGAGGFRHPSARDGRLYLDPTGPVSAAGEIVAPLLDARTAMARFGGRR